MTKAKFKDRYELRIWTLEKMFGRDALKRHCVTEEETKLFKRIVAENPSRAGVKKMYSEEGKTFTTLERCLACHNAVIAYVNYIKDADYNEEDYQNYINFYGKL